MPPGAFLVCDNTAIFKSLYSDQWLALSTEPIPVLQGEVCIHALRKALRNAKDSSEILVKTDISLNMHLGTI